MKLKTFKKHPKHHTNHPQTYKQTLNLYNKNTQKNVKNLPKKINLPPKKIGKKQLQTRLNLPKKNKTNSKNLQNSTPYPTPYPLPLSALQEPPPAPPPPSDAALEQLWRSVKTSQPPLARTLLKAFLVGFAEL